MTAFVLLCFTSLTLCSPPATAKINSDKSIHKQLNSIPEADIRKDRQKNTDLIRTILNKKKVKEKLRTLGYTPKEITERLKRLSDERIHRMAAQLERIKKGGHLGLNQVQFVVLVLMIVLAPVFIPIIVIAYIFGHTIHIHHDAGHGHGHGLTDRQSATELPVP
ncbi:MAG: PA2779 family protein [bacterium]